MLTLDPADKRFWPKTEEVGFSVRKNNWVIEDAIKKHDLNIKKKNAEFDDKLGERVDAVATFLRSKQAQGRKVTPSGIERYFGKATHAHLKGEDIRNKLIEQQRMMITSKKEAYEQEQAQKLISKAVMEGKGKKLNAKKKQKRSKKA